MIMPLKRGCLGNPCDQLLERIVVWYEEEGLTTDLEKSQWSWSGREELVRHRRTRYPMSYLGRIPLKLPDYLGATDCP